MSISFESTPLAEWHKLVGEGQQKSGLLLTESVENYIVLTLNAYISYIDLSSKLIAIDFLNNIHITSHQNIQTLRAVGDQCLILAGLFPDRAKRKRVSADYFSNLGMNAYYVLSYTKISKQLSHTLFYQLFENFSDLTQVLKSMRGD